MYKLFYTSITGTMYKHFALFLLISCALCACRNPNLIKIEGIEAVAISSCINLNNDEWIIDDSETYNNLLDFLNTNDSSCYDYQLPYFDFANRSLLAKRSHALGCTSFYRYEVYADNQNNTYIYQIRADIDSIGCIAHIPQIDMNWLSVPKVPLGYEVVFDLIYE